MYKTVIEYISKEFNSKDVSVLKEQYIGRQYKGGVVESLIILNEDRLVFNPTNKKKKLYKCNLILQFNLFICPSDFYIPCAKVKSISYNAQIPSNIIFTCELYNTNDEKLSVSPNIVPIITLDYKTSDDQQRSMNLRVDDYVNLICIKPIISITNNLYGIISNIAKKIQPIIFIAHNIDAKQFKFSKNEYIAKAICDYDFKAKKVDELVNDNSYVMTPLGFYISAEIGVNAEINALIDICDNWNLLIHNNAKLSQDDLEKLLMFYNF